MASGRAAVASASELLTEMGALVDCAVSPAALTDAVAGVQPLVVASPASEAGVSRVLAFAHARRLHVAPRGGGTQLGIGFPPRACEIVLDLAALNRVLEYNAADMTAVVEAGISLGALGDVLAAEGQWLALDPLLPPTATVGGVVATNASGPRRLRYGGVRDQIIGVRVVRADGVIARGGGKVVKNVAGFDLPKLLTGSLGTLGVISSATFRLYPLPATDGAVLFGAARYQPLLELALMVTGSPLLPSAIGLAGASPPQEAYELCITFEGSRESVNEQLALVEARAGASVKSKGRLDGPSIDAFWRETAHGPTPDGASAVDGAWLGVKASLLPSRVGEWLEALDAYCREQRLAATWLAHAGHGIIAARIRSDPGHSGAVVDQLRAAARRSGGTLIVTAAPLEAEGVDMWGPSPALALTRRVKEQFDPRGILNPGRFLGHS